MNTYRQQRYMNRVNAKRMGSLLVVLTLLCGCTKTAFEGELDAKANERNGFTFPNQTYYCGSEADYDFFVVRVYGGAEQRYRVRKSENVVTNRFDLTKDEARWQGYGLTGLTNIAIKDTVPK